MRVNFSRAIMRAMKRFVQIPNVNEQDGIPNRACRKINDANNQMVKAIESVESRLDSIESAIKIIKERLNL